MPYLELENVGKMFGGFEAIRELDLTVDESQFCALLGPSGCGKSTLLRMIAGLEGVSRGTIRLDGRDVTDVAAAKREIAMVFQSYALYPHMSVRQNIGFSLDVGGMKKDDIARRTDEVAKVLQLEQVLDRKPAALSGGQRQRVAIGRALVRSPKVFLFDEPLSNLDAMLRVKMRFELARLHQRLGTTMIYVTHDQVEAMTLASKIVVLDRGEIAQAGSPLDLYNRPANKFVASFIGSPSMNFLAGAAEGGEGGMLQLRIPGGRDVTVAPRNPHPARPNGDCEIGIRPEHIRAVAPDDPGAALTGAVELVERLGNATIIYVATSAGQIAVHEDGECAVSIDDTIGLTFAADRIHVFGADGKVI